jgi:hypothetical protein
MRRWPLHLALAASALAPSISWAGPWARRAGGAYVRLGAARFEGQAAFLLNESVAQRGRFVGYAGELYAEAGLGRRFELDASWRWVENRSERLDGLVMSSGGPEDLELTLKWSPLAGSMPIAFLVGGRVSLYDRLSEAALFDGTPQRGPGGADLLTGAAWGVSFWPTRAWLSADVLHRLRFGTASSGVRLRVEGGGYVVGPLAVAASVEFQAAYGRQEQQAAGSPAPVPRVLGLGAKVFAELYRGFGVNVDATWLPDVFNDGPGWRLGASVTFERR